MGKGKKKANDQDSSSNVITENNNDNNSQPKQKSEFVSPLVAAAAADAANSESWKKKNKKRNSNKDDSKSKRKRLDQSEEEALTMSLFGSPTIVATNELSEAATTKTSATTTTTKTLNKKKKKKKKNQVIMDDDNNVLFEIDRTGTLLNDTGIIEETSLVPTSNELTDTKQNNDNDDSSVESKDAQEINTEKSVWVDEDDDDIQVDIMKKDGSRRLRKLRKFRSETNAMTGNEFQRRLRDQFQQTTQATVNTDWAKPTTTSSIDRQSSSMSKKIDNRSDNEDNDGEEETENLFSMSSQPLLLSSTTGGPLPPNILRAKRCPDANLVERNKAVTQVVQFHPGSDPNQPLLLTAGYDKTLRFFQCSEEKSEKVHGIHFPNFPITSASFLGDSGKVVVSGLRPNFFIYDSIVGKVDHIPRILGRNERQWKIHVTSGRIIAFAAQDGHIILVDSHSKQMIADLKMNGKVSCLAFTPDGSQLLASGSDGDVYRWDVHSRKCIERFSNLDGSCVTSLATSSTHLAVGATSGVVNLYSNTTSNHSFSSSSFLEETPREPIKSIMNLKTSVDKVKFNSTGQILAMSSEAEQGSLKLLHVPSKTIFSNWPTQNTPLKYIFSMDFSPESKFLALGNDKGNCLLYRLLHYQD